MNGEGFELRSKAILAVYAELEQYARHGRRCVLFGPSGAGKEHAARHFHRALSRHASPAPPFCSVNCGALSAGTAASELFGHRKGAFTGAIRDRAGLLRTASGGVLFLDEIGDMPQEIVPALLRALDPTHGRASAVGDDEDYDTTNVVIIAATERAPSLLRPALLHRLGKQIFVPGLDERDEDLPAATAYFVARALAKCRDARLIASLWPSGPARIASSQADGLARGAGVPIDLLNTIAEDIGARLTPRAMARDWPGHFRALATAVDSAIVCADRRADRAGFLRAVEETFEQHAPRYSEARDGDGRPETASNTPAAPIHPGPAQAFDDALRLQIRAALPATAHRDTEAEQLASFFEARRGVPFMRRDLADGVAGISSRALQDHLRMLEHAGILSRSGGKGQWYRYPAAQAVPQMAMDFLDSTSYVAPAIAPDIATDVMRLMELSHVLKRARRVYLAHPESAVRTAWAVRLAAEFGNRTAYVPLADLADLDRFIAAMENRLMGPVPQRELSGPVAALAHRIYASAGYLFHHCQGADFAIILDDVDRLITGEEQALLVDLLTAWPWIHFILCGSKMGTELATLCPAIELE